MIPITNRCARCGADWWGSHVCPAPSGVFTLPLTLPLVADPPGPPGLRPGPLTEADVRRIVREEIERAMATHLLRPHADPVNPMSAGRT